MDKTKTRKSDMQKMWEQSIQLEGFYTFDEARKKCPKGYRVPTKKEWLWLLVNTDFSFDKKKKEGVFRFGDGFELRLPAAGYRNGNGDSNNQGTDGSYWSSSPSGTSVWDVYFTGSTAFVGTGNRGNAFSVRCVPISIQATDTSEGFDFFIESINLAEEIMQKCPHLVKMSRQRREAIINTAILLAKTHVIR